LVAINRQPDGYDIVFKWFDYLKLKSHKINGDIIPDHLHALISFAAIGQHIKYNHRQCICSCPDLKRDLYFYFIDSSVIVVNFISFILGVCVIRNIQLALHLNYRLLILYPFFSVMV